MYLKDVLDTKLSDLKKNVKANKKHEIVVLSAADAMGSAPASRIGFIIINPMAWHSAAIMLNNIPRINEPSIFSHL